MAIQFTDYLELKDTVLDEFNSVIFFLLVLASPWLGDFLLDSSLIEAVTLHLSNIEAFRKHQKHLKIIFCYVLFLRLIVTNSIFGEFVSKYCCSLYFLGYIQFDRWSKRNIWHHDDEFMYDFVVVVNLLWIGMICTRICG